MLNPEGIAATVPAPTVIAPSVASNLPCTVLFIPTLRAPGCEIKDPFKVLPSPIVRAPSDIQKTLAALVPPVKIISVPTPTVNAPSNLMIK